MDFSDLFIGTLWRLETINHAVTNRIEMINGTKGFFVKTQVMGANGIQKIKKNNDPLILKTE